MAARPRRAIPDNLDPLVDTLANVVGILVIVIVLTQIELGDALARVMLLDSVRTQREQSHAEAVPAIEQTLAERADALSRRTDVELDRAAALAQSLLAALAAVPADAPDRADEAGAELERVAALRQALDAARVEAEAREAYAEAIREVPARMVARLPDPEVVRGREVWVMVRHGRIYLVDRAKLFDAGSQSIARILADGQDRRIREDEFEAVALYLRKRVVGDRNFRWQLETEPSPRVELVWQTTDAGIDPASLGADPRWRAWLAGLERDKDFVRFQVWSDSFEAYLVARQSIEEAGLRGGWTGYAEDEELVRILRFAPRPPEQRPVEVD